MCNDYGYYGSREDGALADYIKVKADNLLRLPDNVSYEEVYRSSSVSLHALRKSGLKPGDMVAVLG